MFWCPITFALMVRGKGLMMLHRSLIAFSSPIHLLVRDDALMLKKVALMLLAMALPMRVLPVPGGPKRSRPLGGARAPCRHTGNVWVA